MQSHEAKRLGRKSGGRESIEEADRRSRVSGSSATRARHQSTAAAVSPDAVAAAASPSSTRACARVGEAALGFYPALEVPGPGNVEPVEEGASVERGSSLGIADGERRRLFRQIAREHVRIETECRHTNEQRVAFELATQPGKRFVQRVTRTRGVASRQR